MTATTQPKLLYFYSPKSGLSRRVEAFLDQVLQERRNHKAFSRAAVNVDRTPQLAEHFEVEDVPAIVVLEDVITTGCTLNERVGVPKSTIL